MRVSTCLSLCVSLLPLFLLAQGGYVNVTSAQGLSALNQYPVLGAGASFIDFDNDGWDDLSFPLNNDSLKFYRNNNGAFEPMPSFGPNTGDAKHICWFDMDNDGDRDVMVTYYLAPTLLFRNDGGWQFTDITEEAGIPTHPIAKTFGASCGDYDKDGFLDIYLANYNWITGPTNWLLHNNGDGTFEEVAQQLGVDNDENPSFQSSWIDYNNDSWPDIYVINDKDPENAMYRNNGDGTFTDVSEETGTNVVLDAMSNAICDYDNNGFLDIYITNSSTGNALLKNNGDGTFSDATLDAGMSVFALSWGTTWVDHDNNLLDDAMVLTTYAPINHRNYFYENQGDGTFEDITADAGLYQDTPLSYSNAKGDFNNDGYFDLAVSNIHPDKCYLYQNNGGMNNYLKLELEGVVSNKDAVGTWVDYYIQGSKYVEYTTSGENYLSQDSHSEILSMGSQEVIDSLFIHWPSGQRERFTSIEANQTLHILEGSTLSNSVNHTGSNIICTGDSLLLDAGDFQTYSWNNGDTTRYISITEPGDYSVQTTNQFGLEILSDTLSIGVVDAIDYSTSSTSVLCNGHATGTIELNVDEEDSIALIEWNNGDTTTTLTGLLADVYYFLAIDENGCLLQDSVHIYQPEVLCSEESIIPATCFDESDGSIEVQVCGGVPEYTIEWGELDPLNLPAGIHSYVVSDGNNCTATFDFEVESPPELTAIIETTAEMDDSLGSASIIVSGGTEPYVITWNMGDHTETIDGLNAGTYTVQVVDANGCTIFDSCIIEFSIGLDELASAGYKVYPNPIIEGFHIDQLQPNSRVRISDMKGRIVWSAISVAGENFNISSLSSGMYVLSVTKNEIELYRTLISKQD